MLLIFFIYICQMHIIINNIVVLFCAPVKVYSLLTKMGVRAWKYSVYNTVNHFSSQKIDKVYNRKFFVRT